MSSSEDTGTETGQIPGDDCSFTAERPRPLLILGFFLVPLLSRRRGRRNTA